MLIMVIEWNDELSAKRSERIVSAPLGARLPCQYRHSLDIPCHRDQRPLALHGRQATQQELPEAHHRLDDAEYRLPRLLAQGVGFATLARLEPMLHSVHRTGRLVQRRRLGESLFPVRVMAIAPCRKQRFDLRRHATLSIRRAE